MSQDASIVERSNPLILPLLIVSVVAVAEAVGLVLLLSALAHRPEPMPTASVQAAAVASSQNSPHLTSDKGASPRAVAPRFPPVGETVAPDRNREERGFALGKKGQPVQSDGYSITVEQINYEPAYKSLADWGDDYRYLALLITVENNSGGNAELLPATFRLQDDQGYPYKQLGLKLTEPRLPLTVLGNREKVRGYLDFVIPKTAKGLMLVYSGVPTRNAQPIHVELGE